MVRGGERGSAEHLAEFVGQRRPIKVIEVNRRKRRLVMSEREAMREWRADRKAALLSELSVGDVRTGRVNAISDFGAFVDLGGADGLIHVSELSHDRTRHPRDVVKVGQEVEVVVLDIDAQRNRIGLSMKRLQKDPWEVVEQDHYVGELVDATIANLADFGAFARLADGLEGLIHISELSDGHIDHPREAVRAGQVVTVEIISIDAGRRRIGLSIRRVPDHLRRTEDAAPDGGTDEPGAEALEARAGGGATCASQETEEPQLADATSGGPDDAAVRPDDASAEATEAEPEGDEGEGATDDAGSNGGPDDEG
jgi:small subunit ribosomal protein S1